MRSLLIAAAASALMLGGCNTMMGAEGSAGASAAGTGAMPASMTPTTASAYMQVAASNDMYEIQSSQLAAGRAQNPALRSFGEMMIRDHTNTTQQLTAAATAAGMGPPPMAMLPMHAEMVARLQARSGADFDREYARQQLIAHQQAVALHSNFAARGDVPALRAVAAAAVPVVTQHLNMVRQWPR
jgi:putative membrane protein